jgi:hypothetical protein
LAPICEAFVAEVEFSDLETARDLLNSLPAGPAGLGHEGIILEVVDEAEAS